MHIDANTVFHRAFLYQDLEIAQFILNVVNTAKHHYLLMLCSSITILDHTCLIIEMCTVNERLPSHTQYQHRPHVMRSYYKQQHPHH